MSDYIQNAKYFSQNVIDKDNIPIILLLVLIVVLAIFIEKTRKIFIVLGLLLSALILGLFIKPTETAKLLPFVKVEISMTRELGNDENYTMYLTTESDDNRFIFSEQVESDLETWLGEQADQKIHLRVDKKGETVYDKTIGVVETSSYKTFYAIYQYWVENNIVPEEVQRYKIWKFYLDV